MKKLTEGGDPQYDPTLGVAFACFLTTAAAKNRTANLNKSLKEVKSDIYKKWDVDKMCKDLKGLMKKK